MEVKNKPVTLEDLKELKEWMEGVAEVYKDITDTLTWNDATWYINNSSQKSTDRDTGYTGVKVAKLSVNAGEKFRVYSWFRTNYANGTANALAMPFVLADSSDAVIGVSQGNPGTINGTSGNGFVLGYHESTITIPASCKYLYIFNHAGHADFGKSVGDIIVEKAQ